MDKHTTKAPDMPAFTTTSAMRLLWAKTSSKLAKHEQEWFVEGATEHISVTASALKTTVEEIASYVNDDTPLMRGRSELSCLLFNISNQLEIVDCLAGMANDAAYLAQEAREGGKP